MTDLDMMLRAVVDAPDDDTARLVYADTIQEAGDDTRAELIRVQCELTRHYPHVASGDHSRWTGHERFGYLVRRANELIAENETRWRKGPACVRCLGTKSNSPYTPNIHEECGECNGTGDAGGLLTEWRLDERHDVGLLYGVKRLRNRVHFRRGFIERVDVPALMDLLRTSGGVPVGEYRPSDWLRAVLTATPERELIREVVPLDREPMRTATGIYLWASPGGWADRGQDATLPQFLIGEITVNMRGGDERERGPARTCHFNSREEAVAALGRAIVKWARKEVSRDRH